MRGFYIDKLLEIFPFLLKAFPAFLQKSMIFSDTYVLTRMKFSSSLSHKSSPAETADRHTFLLSLLDSESLPFLELPPAFLCAIIYRFDFTIVKFCLSLLFSIVLSSFILMILTFFVLR